MEASDPVAEHYGRGGLRDRLAAAIDGVEAETGTPITIDELSGATEFHVGGRAATLDLRDRLDLGPDDRVLDLGSGLGGPARLIAATTGATVLGVDLTPEFVDVATWLTDRLGDESLANRVEFQVGSATEVVVEPGSFTASTMLHVGMNIADKTALASSVASALAPGGRFGIYDIMAGDNDGPIDYPVPWATDSVESHVASADDYVRALESAGFTIQVVENRVQWAAEQTQQQRQEQGPRSPLHLGLVMGPDIRAKVANLTASMGDGRVAPTVIVARRNG